MFISPSLLQASPGRGRRGRKGDGGRPGRNGVSLWAVNSTEYKDTMSVLVEPSILARLITAVGKPVFHRHTNNNYGSWMRDTNNETDPHYWTTDPNHNDILKEFANKNDFRNNGRSITYQLPTPFQMLFSWDKGNLLTYPVRESGMDTGPPGSDYKDHGHSSS
ncbi:hypothetical protein Pcinc_019424 [Petrolisthes cinctipes]|uniref:Olfactomedin-like domain-containing protein n=1 Tax=Petrolisthes cinctipes TaxID=88211 RepID=A0AAE1KKF3_PETCI|nr:hypothetical protein Pcinc_019424 [Petrolisthes cinctipes]